MQSATSTQPSSTLEGKCAGNVRTGPSPSCSSYSWRIASASLGSQAWAVLAIQSLPRWAVGQLRPSTVLIPAMSSDAQG